LSAECSSLGASRWRCSEARDGAARSNGPAATWVHFGGSLGPDERGFDRESQRSVFEGACGELESLSAIEVPACRSCAVSRLCRSAWEFEVCGALVRVRIDSEWAKIVGREFAESDVLDVEYAELFGRSAQKTTRGVRHRVVDLLFRHGHYWRAHIEYAAPTSCADQIDAMIATAHAPSIFPGGPPMPLRHDP